VLAWSVLELLAESVNPANPQRAALDLFDRLRLRDPLGHAFEALGFEAEESWRVAARIKVALLIEAKVFVSGAPEPVALSAFVEVQNAPRPIPVLSPALWQDPDVRWLTGVHQAEGSAFFVKEPYEELLWWIELPALCKLAAEPAPARSAFQEIGNSIAAAARAAASAGYSLDRLFEGEQGEAAAVDPANEVNSVKEEADEKVPSAEPGE
jgi:hypothetical protein